MIDLEPLIGGFDPGMILVGPLLSSWNGSSHRYFRIAGDGSKVYRSVDLGVVVVETEAQKQRADLIERLESRFAGVAIFGTHLEMVHAVHALWPNSETAEVLASAALAAHPEPTRLVGVYQSIDDSNDASALPCQFGKQLVDQLIREPVDDAIDFDVAFARDQEPPLPVLP